ncbi:MAG: hypothetical protein ACXAC7_21460, partial [Candidatus Hodarchaeales archaeon]
MESKGFVIALVLSIFFIYPMSSINSQIEVQTGFENNNSTKLLLDKQSFDEGNQLTNDFPIKSNNEKLERITTDYNVGDSDQFWVLHLTKAGNNRDDDGDGIDYNDNDWDEAIYEITGVVVNKTAHAYIIVEQSLASSYQNNGIAGELALEFEEKIYNKMVPELGEPTDNDLNSRIVILIFEFKENYGSVYTTGFFWPLHQFSPSNDPKDIEYYSEYKELIHINHRAIQQEIDLLAPTLAHEFFHLIHFAADENENLWLEEGFAVFSEHYTNYQLGYIDYLYNEGDPGFFQKSDISLTYWESTFSHYGASFLFVLYLSKVFGIEFIHELIQSTDFGIPSIRSLIHQNQTNLLSFEDIYRDWTVTNYINNPNQSPYYYLNFSYSIANNSKINSPNLTNLPANLINRPLKYWSSQYFNLPDGHTSSYEVTFLPELVNRTYQYQLTLLEKIKDSNYWKINPINLYENHSMSFIIPNNSSVEKRILLVSSLSGTSSGYFESNIEEKSSSNFHLFLNSVDYVITTGKLLIHPNKNIEIKDINIKLLNGTKISESNIKQANYQFYRWDNNSEVNGYFGSMVYDQVNKSWFIPSTSLENLPETQFFVIYSFQLESGEIVKGYSPGFTTMFNTE